MRPQDIRQVTFTNNRLGGTVELTHMPTGVTVAGSTKASLQVLKQRLLRQLLREVEANKHNADR